MWYKPKKVKKLALNSQLLTVQILTSDVEVLILCLSYFITTVTMQEVTRKKNHDFFQLYSCKGAAEMKGNFFGYRSDHQTFPFFVLQFIAVLVFDLNR